MNLMSEEWPVVDSNTRAISRELKMFNYWLRLQTPYWLIVPLFLLAMLLEFNAPYRQIKRSTAASAIEIRMIEETATNNALNRTSNASD